MVAPIAHLIALQADCLGDTAQAVSRASDVAFAVEISGVASLTGLAEVILVADYAEGVVTGHTHIRLEISRSAYRAESGIGTNLTVGISTGHAMRIPLVGQVVSTGA